MTLPLSTEGIVFGTVSDCGLANRVLTDEECVQLGGSPPPTLRRSTGWYKAAHKARVAWKTERQPVFPPLRALAPGQASHHFDLPSVQGSSLQARIVGVEAGRPWAIDDIEFEMDGVKGSQSLLGIADPAGGTFNSAPPTQIGPKQSPKTLNCSYEGKRTRRRRGYEIVNNASTGVTAAKTAVFDATDSAGNTYILAMIAGTLYQLDGSVLLELDTGWDQDSIPTVCTVGLKTFILSPGRQRVFQQGSILTLGVVAPTSAPLYISATPNVTNGVVGLTPGYEYIYTFYDGTKATESGPSPSTLVVLPSGSSPSSLLFELDVSASTTVTERRVYRRKRGTETWFSVGDIADNTTTSFTDSAELPGSDILESPLGVFVTAEFPPITACARLPHENRLVGFGDTEDGRQVWISETGDGERWHVFNVFSACSKMEAAVSNNGRLILLSDSTVEVLEGDWIRGSSGLLGIARRVLATSKGCSGPHAACEADGKVFWHDIAGIHTVGRSWDLKDVTLCVSNDIQATMQAVVDTANSGVVLRYNHISGELWCLMTKAVPTPQTGDGPTERIVATMHLDTGRWGELPLPLTYAERVKDGDVGFRFMGADSYGDILELNVLDGDGVQGNESWFPASTAIAAASATAKTIQVTGASFPATLRGAGVVLVDVSASLYYRRIILSASGDTLTLDDVPSTLVATDEVHVGGMVQLLDTRAENGGRPGIKTFKMLQFSFADATVGSL